MLASCGRIGLTLGLVGAKTGRVWSVCRFLELSSHCSPSRVQARFDAGELITQRELVSRQVSEDLTERAATFGLILDDVSLVRVLPFRFFSLECAQIRAVEKRINGWLKLGHVDYVRLPAVACDVATTAQVGTSGVVTGLQ